MVKFYHGWIAAAVVLLCNGSAQAYLCMCMPVSCILLHPNSEFFEQAESFCSTFRTAAHDISIVKLMDTKLSSNAFLKFPNMTALEIYEGKLESIGPETFSGTGKLTKLLIKGNNLSSLEDYSFKGADNLKDLMITSNPLSKIAENAFANLHSLEILILAHGEVSSLPKNIFQNNRMLKMISLTSNKLTTIEEDVFKGLDELTKLELGNNRLTTFDYKFLKASVVLVNNNSLEHLVINEHCTSMHASNNKIKTISVDGANVMKLGLIHNRITDISNITKLSNLTSLALGNNLLKPDTVFSSLPALEELMLQSTYINLTSETFENLVNLKILDLSFNNLTEADFKIFSPPNVLQVLSYVGNRVKNFNYAEAKEFLPRLRVLEICKNGWNTTYFETNIMRMRRFNLSPDMHGFHFLFRDDFITTCSDKLILDDYVYDYGESPSEDYVEAEFKAAYPKEKDMPLLRTTTTTTTTPRPVTTTTPIATTEILQHHVKEYETNVAAVPLAKGASAEPEQKGASPFYITFHVLVYILSAVGLVSLGVVAYLWKKRQLGVRSLTTVQGSTDAVRLI